MQRAVSYLLAYFHMIRLNSGYRTDLSTDMLIVFICTIGPKTVAEGKREVFFKMAFGLDQNGGGLA